MDKNTASGWEPRKSVPVGEDEKAARALVERLQRDNPTYWTIDRIITMLYAHNENHMAAIEQALAPEWEAAQREVFDGGNAGWTMVACTAIQMIRERANHDLTSRTDPPQSQS